MLARADDAGAPDAAGAADEADDHGEADEPEGAVVDSHPVQK